MSNTTLSTKGLFGMRVQDAARGKRIGKVRHFIFHPSERRVVGFTVKRPDAAMMFHRKDVFVALDGFDIEEDVVVVRDDAAATGKAALKTLGISWDECVIWVGMPVVTEAGEALGYVSGATFDRKTGEVEQISIDSGIANDIVLGKCVIPGSLVKGFKRGQGESLALTGDADNREAEEQAAIGAILVSDEAARVTREGGAAAAAGKATAVAADKAKRGAGKARKVVSKRVVQAKPAAQDAARKAGEAVESGTFAVGRQIGKASGMFSAFKDEFKKAANEGGKEE